MTMDIFDRFRALRKKKSLTAAELEAGVTDARELWQSLKDQADREALRHPEYVLDSAAEAARHQRVIDDLAGQVQVAAVFLADLEKAHKEVSAAQVEAGKLAKHAAAQKLSLEVAKELEAEYPKLARGFLLLLHRVTLANEAVDQANADLPSGGRRIPRPEEVVRDVPELPRKDLHERVVSRWVLADGDGKQPLSSDQADRVLSSNGKTGVLPGGGYTQGVGAVMRAFREIEYQAAVPSRAGGRIVNMKIPALRSGGLDFWEGVRPHNLKAEDIRRRLDQVDANGKTEGPPRRVQVELIATAEPSSDERRA